MKLNHEVLQKFKEFRLKAKKHIGKGNFILRSKRGVEYLKGDFFSLSTRE